MKKKLDVVIVNWNSGDQLFSCLESIKYCSTSKFNLNKVIIVDNHSSDNSLSGLSNLDLSIKIIKNKKNEGFAYACNQGAEKSESDYILFLNPDTRLFKNSLSKPLEFMEKSKNEDIGIVGIQLIDDKHNIQKTSSRFPDIINIFNESIGLNIIFPNLFKGHFMKDWDHKENREVDQVMGAFFLTSREVFEELNGFDERFFVYYEEVDFSYRAKKRGYKSFYLADVQAFHKGGGTSEQVKAARLFYSLRSRIQYSFKHFSKFKAVLVFFITVFIEVITRSIYNILFEKSLNNFKETIKGYYYLYKDLPELFNSIIEY